MNGQASCEELTECVNMITKGRICAVSHPRVKGVGLCVEFWVLYIPGGDALGLCSPT